jgi:hypothetical protein
MGLFGKKPPPSRRWKAGGMWEMALMLGWHDPAHKSEGLWEKGGEKVPDGQMVSRLLTEIRSESEEIEADPGVGRFQLIARRCRMMRRILEEGHSVSQWACKETNGEVKDLMAELSDAQQDLLGEIVDKIKLQQRIHKQIDECVGLLRESMGGMEDMAMDIVNRLHTHAAVYELEYPVSKHPF